MVKVELVRKSMQSTTVILNESNETSYIGTYSTPVKIGPPNTKHHQLFFADVYRFYSWIVKTREEMMQ
uniref:Uncharacterized protein n=1 Tax=Romanomermis culicivorax TaxID=13658 RepID=A0A915LAP3_ROMCU